MLTSKKATILLWRFAKKTEAEEVFSRIYKLAERGDTLSQIDVGQFYAEGEGVDKEYAQAYKWYSIAAAQGFLKAQQAREMIAEKMTPDQIAQAQKLASEFRPVTK